MRRDISPRFRKYDAVLEQASLGDAGGSGPTMTGCARLFRDWRIVSSGPPSCHRPIGWN